ncbi:hypothetical protein ACHQM5_008747 [Ranunculus cassubicifolius]
MDRITYLPDSIRSCIVSFLPMKDAFRASVLSKQWRDVCRSLSTLDFSQEIFESKVHEELDFKDFVYQTLLRHDGSDVEKFHLRLSSANWPVCHLNSWISFAIHHNVKEIILWLLGEGNNTIPQLLFTCQSLTRLTVFAMKEDLNLPSTIWFPVLKTLVIGQVNFNSNNKSYRLISRCPMLEVLNIVDCIWDSSNIIVVSHPNLRMLELLAPGHAFKIRVPNLRLLLYTGGPLDISAEDLSSLVEVDIRYHKSSLKSTKVTSVHMSKILAGLQNVVTLTLSKTCIELLCKDQDLSSHLPTSYSCLKHLHLDLVATNPNFQVAILLLKSCVNIQVFSVTFSRPDASTSTCNMEGCFEAQNSSNEGTLNRLITASILWFGGSDCELDFVRHLVKISKHISITFDPDLDAERQRSIEEKLVELNKASTYAYDVIRFAE